MIKRQPTFDRDIEKRICIGIIVSDKIARELIPTGRKNFFEISSFKLVFQWTKKYFEVYKESPKKHIKDIYLQEKSLLKDTEKELIEEMLATLSEEYESSGINEEYIITSGRTYFKKQSIIKSAEEASELAQSGNLSEAEVSLQKFSQFSVKQLSPWKNVIGDESLITRVFEEAEEPTFSLHGELGRLTGSFFSEYLVGVMGPMKRGKTFFLMEIALNAILSRKKTVFVSLEMGEIGLSSRMYSTITALGTKSSLYEYPIFDCKRNQDGSCQNPNRTNTQPKPPKFEVGQRYRPCTWCRENDPKSFKVTTWKTVEKRNKINPTIVKKRMDELRRVSGGNNYRQISYPPFGANISDILSDIEILEYRDGFIPEVIIVDYADILAPEALAMRHDYRHQIDATWKALKSMASTRKCVVFTGSQSNRDSFEAETIRERHTAEDIRKLAHLDVMLTLNQTPQEQTDSVMRIGVLEHRWKQFSKSRQALVLQQLSCGQFVLDSEIVIMNLNEGKGGKKK